MKVAIVTSGRFHSFDQARELARRDAFAAIISGFPMSKLANEKGLPEGSIQSFPLWQPWVHLAGRLRLPRALRLELEWRAAQGIDGFAARHLPEADALIALSSSGLQAGKAMQSRGGIYVCDRGSTHIRHQNDSLAEEYQRYGLQFNGVDPRKMDKEEAEYAQADGIFVPTNFVASTFVARGVAPEKLKRAPYGVDLSFFSPVAEPPADEFRILFVGQLSVRKGLKYLFEAFERFQHPKKHLTLVGSPSTETASLVAAAVAKGNVTATGPVPKAEVREHMSRSHVMVLPSVEEGLALVQGQALACGCPVIATPNTGSEDLYTDGKEGFVVPLRDADAIYDRLTRLADEPELREQMRMAAQVKVKDLGGWDSYGQTIYDHLAQLTGRA